jgi:hypothetical protein
MLTNILLVFFLSHLRTAPNFGVKLARPRLGGRVASVVANVTRHAVPDLARGTGRAAYTNDVRRQEPTSQWTSTMTETAASQEQTGRVDSTPHRHARSRSHPHRDSALFIQVKPRGINAVTQASRPTPRSAALRPPAGSISIRPRASGHRSDRRRTPSADRLR